MKKYFFISSVLLLLFSSCVSSPNIKTDKAYVKKTIRKDHRTANVYQYYDEDIFNASYNKLVTQRKYSAVCEECIDKFSYAGYRYKSKDEKDFINTILVYNESKYDALKYPKILVYKNDNTVLVYTLSDDYIVTIDIQEAIYDAKQRANLRAFGRTLQIISDAYRN